MIHNNLVLITGGAKGLGQYVAKRFLLHGFTVIVTSRESAFHNATSISHNTIINQQLDVTNVRSIENLFSWINALDVKLSVLINNAGVGIFNSFHKISLEEWNLVLQTNLTGAFQCAKETYINMLKNEGGRIINIGSIAEKIPLAQNAAYGVSKAGLRLLSSIINEEGAAHKIRSTHVTLGAVYTDIWKNRNGFNKEDMLDPDLVAKQIVHVALQPLDIRIDHIEILPEKGVL